MRPGHKLPSDPNELDGATKAEVQGYVVDGESHTWGASHSRRWQALQAGLHLLLHYRAPPLRMVERLLGKLGFCQGMRPCTRRPLQYIYRGIVDTQEGPRRACCGARWRRRRS